MACQNIGEQQLCVAIDQNINNESVLPVLWVLLEFVTRVRSMYSTRMCVLVCLFAPTEYHIFFFFWKKRNEKKEVWYVHGLVIR